MAQRRVPASLKTASPREVAFKYERVAKQGLYVGGLDLGALWCRPPITQSVPILEQIDRCFPFHVALSRACSHRLFQGQTDWRRCVVTMRFEAGCVPAGSGLVHDPAPLRLISGLGCAPGPRVALIASLRACGHQARGLQSLIWESHARPAVQEIYLGRLFFCRRVEHRKLGSGRLPALAVRARAGQSAASARALAGTPKKDHSAFGADGLSRSRKKRPTIFRRKPSTQQESRRASAVKATRGLSSKHNDDRTFH